MTVKLDAYEYISLVIPGSVVAIVLALLAPDVRELLGQGGVDIGGLGVVVLIALVSGYLLQAVGNFIELLEQKLGINPSERLRRFGFGPVSKTQYERAKQKILDRGHGDIASLSASDWRALRGEMVSEIRGTDPNNRLDVMLRMYGLGRGLVSAFMLSICLTFLFPGPDGVRWKYIIVLGIGLLLSYVRARRFSHSYLRELIIGYNRGEYNGQK